MKRVLHSAMRAFMSRPNPVAPSSGKWPDSSHGGNMYGRVSGSPGPPGSYGKPRLERLGTFRELTQSGGAAFSDLFTTDNADGCVMTSSSSYTCNDSPPT